MPVDIMLRTEGVSFSVNQKALLRDISLEIPQGSFVGLIGPNGCGKSTLLKTIYRAYKADEGTVYLDGRDMSGLSNREMAKRMAVVTQEHDISFDFSVMEMMMIGRYAHRKAFSTRDEGDEELCLEALRSVGMEDFRHRSFLSLSGGEKQRVLIASAFSRNTKLLLLDEPVNHLDIGYQFLIMDIMKKRTETTIFVSVHDMNLALTYCDKVIALHKGEVVAAGRPEEVITIDLLRQLYRVDAEILQGVDGTRFVRYLRSAG